MKESCSAISAQVSLTSNEHNCLVLIPDFAIDFRNGFWFEIHVTYQTDLSQITLPDGSKAQYPLT